MYVKHSQIAFYGPFFDHIVKLSPSHTLICYPKYLNLAAMFRAISQTEDTWDIEDESKNISWPHHVLKICIFYRKQSKQIYLTPSWTTVPRVPLVRFHTVLMSPVNHKI